ncbi:hypothetical protein VPH35_121489 [Triticum aestivum]
MDPIVNQGWTSSEVEEACSLIARINTNKIMYDSNDDKNKKHNYIVNSLHALFPSKTMKQVTDLYIDLAVEMHMTQWREGTHVTSGSAQNIFTFCDPVNGNYELPMEENGASSTHGIYTMGDHANENFVPVNKQKSFLYGLEVYGRGDWKNISKHFVTTKTPVQVSSHAQKFFKRIQKKASSGTKHYSINDVRLHDNELLAENNSSVTRQALSFTGLNNDPSFKLQAPTSSSIVMNNQAQCSPSIYNQQVGHQPMWSEQQMMGSIAAVMDGVGNYVPDGQQGSAYFYLGNV